MPEPTTPQLSESDVEAIEARANAATEGPWQLGGNYWDRNSVTAKKGEHFIADCGKHPLSAEFIAHARTDIPALIRDWRALKTELERAHLARSALERFDEVQKANTRAAAENAVLREQLAQMTKERDDARRDAEALSAQLAKELRG